MVMQWTICDSFPLFFMGTSMNLISAAFRVRAKSNW